MRFFIGIHEPAHLGRFFAGFLSVNRLRDRKADFAANRWILDSGAFGQLIRYGEFRDDVAANRWILDSGAFGQLIRYGEFRDDVATYAAQVNRWSQCGELLACVCQDYLVSEAVLAQTGLTVEESQQRTIDRYDALRQLTPVYVMPVLHGQTTADYLAHLAAYGDRLAPGAWVGAGSLVGRFPEEVESILLAIKLHRPDLCLHGFGVKVRLLEFPLIRESLYSADSMAWSYAARREKHKRHFHRSHHHPIHALLYLQRVKTVINQAPTPPLTTTDLIQYLLSRNHRQRVEDSINAIRCLKHLESSEQEADEGDRMALLSFAGFGTLGRLFTGQKAPQWEEAARAELLALLQPDELITARNTILNAFPTSPEVVQSMWRLVQKLGFQGGRVLDPGCGIGHFLTFCPDELKPLIRYVGVEIDKITNQIALELHPALSTAFYNRSFLEFLQPASSFDLVIGNDPFEDGTQAGYNGFPHPVALHARFVIKGLEMLKPGGFMVMMTSTGAMDSVGQRQEYRQWREYVDRRAVFMGAVRLPSQSSQAISGTECCADVLVLQKRYEDDDRESLCWLGTVDSMLTEYKTGNPIKLNEFYQDNPEFLLGTPIRDKTTFGEDFALSWDADTPFIEALDDAFDAIAAHVQVMTTDQTTDQATETVSTPNTVPNTVPNTNQTPQGDTTMYARATVPTHAALDQPETVRLDWRAFTVRVNTGSKGNGIELRFPDEPPVSVKNQLKGKRFRYKDDNGDKRWWTTQDAEGERLTWAQGFARQYDDRPVEFLEVGEVDYTPSQTPPPTPHSPLPTPEPISAARRRTESTPAVAPVEAAPVADDELELEAEETETAPPARPAVAAVTAVRMVTTTETPQFDSLDAFLDSLINMASDTMESLNEDALREQERRARVQQLLAEYAEDTAAKLAMPRNSENAYWLYYKLRTKFGLAAVGLAMGSIRAAMQMQVPPAPNPDLVNLTRDRSAQLPNRSPLPTTEQVGAIVDAVMQRQEDESLGK